MARTINYKSLRGILRQTLHNELSVSDVICGRFYHKTLGWVSFRLSDDAMRTFVFGICHILNMRRDRDIVYYNIRNHRIEDCGILERATVRHETDGLYFSYCAGQDYPSEARLVRRLLRCK